MRKKEIEQKFTTIRKILLLKINKLQNTKLNIEKDIEKVQNELNGWDRYLMNEYEVNKKC